jgi:hypothetical protein
MMMKPDDANDETLRALLRASVPAPPVDDVDWTALHARTVTDAAPVLRRRGRSWWQVLAGTSDGARYLAAAASLALVITAAALMPERPSTAARTYELRTIEEELALGVPYSSVPLLAADADNSTVIDALLLFDGEEW